MNLRLHAFAASLCAATLPAQLSGNFVIDPTGPPGTFPTFTSAVNAMFVTGINGPCNFDVVPGSYVESVMVPPIPGMSAANPITFRAAAGPGTVLINGAAGDTFVLLAVAFLHNRSIVWDGIDFMGAPGHAISATTFVEDLEIRNCHFAAGHQSTAPGEYRHAVIVSENSGNEEGWRIHHNRITLSSYTNRPSYGIYLSNGGDWDIHHNTFDANNGDHVLWLINNNTRIDRIHNNLFVGSLHSFGGTYANNSTAIRGDISNHENYIVHNTFAMTLPVDGCCIATGGYVSGAFTVQNYIYGNVFYTQGGTAICVNNWGSGPHPFLSDGNVFFCPGGEIGRTDPQVPGATTLAAWQIASGQDTYSLEADPQLNNPFGVPPDLRPAPSSPITGVAVNTPAYVTDDFAGRLRDATPDAGAYESTSFALYGQGCPGTGALVPAMSGSGNVVLGSTNFAFELTQAPALSLAVLIGGFSRTTSVLGPLPAPIGGGCAILASPDTTSAFVTSPTGTVTMPFAIPNSPTLSGLDLFFQWAIVDPASGSPLGLTTSDAGALQL